MGYFTNFQEAATLPTHEEMIDPEPSPTETVSSDGFEATRVFQMAWASRIAFIDTALGWASGKTYRLPIRYPANPRAVAVSAAVKGAGKATAIGGVLAWEAARVTVSYKVPEYETQIGASRELLVTEQLEGAAEFITVPAIGLYWDLAKTEPLTGAEAPGMLRKLQTWNYTMCRLPTIPTDLPEVGTLNLRPVASTWYQRVFEPYTLLAGVPIIKNASTVAGVLAWDVTLSFTHNPNGWNKLLRKGGKLPQPIYAEYEKKVGPPGYEKIVLVVGEYPIYPSQRFQPYVKETLTA